MIKPVRLNAESTEYIGEIMRIELENIVIRNASISDAPILNSWWNDGKVMEHAGFPYGLGESLQQTIENIVSAQGKQRKLCIIEIDGVPVGEISYSIKNNTAYPGFKICNGAYQNRGYGTKIILMLFEFLFNDRELNTPEPIEKIKWDTMLSNTRAIHVYEHKIGAKKSGIEYKAWKDQLGEFRDAVYFEISRDEFLRLHTDKSNNGNIMDAKGFDKWASSYDESVSKNENENRYPFAAYTEVMEEVNRQLIELSGSEILDMGIGTGKNTSKLYKKGYSITGVDFSSEMLKLAKEKMPDIKTIKHDFKDELPKEITSNKYDSILFTYSIHHLNDDEKSCLLNNLYPLLKKEGKIIIGDVMTQTESEMIMAQERDNEIWDFDEHYIIVEKLVSSHPEFRICFYPKSYCSGVLVLNKLTK